MTYKAIVKGLIERSADEWATSLLEENGIPFLWTSVELTEIDMEKYHALWTCKVTITEESNRTYTIYVGGSADDLLGICNSVIWDDNHKEIWFAVPKTREMLGITEFDPRKCA